MGGWINQKYSQLSPAKAGTRAEFGNIIHPIDPVYTNGTIELSTEVNLSWSILSEFGKLAAFTASTTVLSA